MGWIMYFKYQDKFGRIEECEDGYHPLILCKLLRGEMDGWNMVFTEERNKLRSMSILQATSKERRDNQK